jgi:hypothetical protein
VPQPLERCRILPAKHSDPVPKLPLPGHDSRLDATRASILWRDVYFQWELWSVGTVEVADNMLKLVMQC